MAADLDEELDRIFAARDRDHMQPTIDAVEGVLREHPDSVRAVYEVGGAHDSAGNEQTAVGFYERALTLGLAGDLRRRCLLQYGSTLRNLDRLDDSLAVFDDAIAEYADSTSLLVFRALTLHAAHRVDEGFALLLDLIAGELASPEIDRYAAALRGNAEYIRGLAAAETA